MNEEQLKEFLKENLAIECDVKEDYEFDTQGNTRNFINVNIKLSFNGELISEDLFCFTTLQ